MQVGLRGGDASKAHPLPNEAVKKPFEFQSCKKRTVP